MMIQIAPLLIAGLWLAFAFAPTRSDAFADARRRMTWVCAASLLALVAVWLFSGSNMGNEIVTLGGWQFALSDPGFAGTAPALIAGIGIVAVAMADSISHSISTLRRMLALLALAMAFVSVREPVLLALLWGLSPWIAWLELRERFGGRGVARLFAVYHVASVACFVASIVLGSLGYTLAGLLIMMPAIGLRESMFPGHSWFPRFVEKAPLGLVVAFTAPQLGLFAHLAILSDSLPPDVARFVPLVGAVTAVVAGALGVVQTSARRALAYFMMSQTALVSLALDGRSQVGLAGSLLDWQVLALATTGFAMTISALEARRGELSLATHSGYFSRTPRMAAGFMMMGLASVGFPMTLGFVAEDLLAQGAIESNPAWAFALIAATALNGMAVMRAFFRLFSGRRIHIGETDLTGRESYALSLVLLALLIGGIAPSWLVSQEFGHPTSHGVTHAASHAAFNKTPHSTLQPAGIASGAEMPWLGKDTPKKPGATS